MSTVTPLRNADVLTLVAALAALDGRQEAVRDTAKDGKVVERLVHVPYEFGGMARLHIVLWMKRLREIADTLSEVHDGLVRQHALPAKPDEVAPEFDAAFRKAWDEVLKATVEVDTPKLAYADLRDEKNKLPPSVLTALLPIIHV